MCTILFHDVGVFWFNTVLLLCFVFMCIYYTCVHVCTIIIVIMDVFLCVLIPCIIINNNIFNGVAPKVKLKPILPHNTW